VARQTSLMPGREGMFAILRTHIPPLAGTETLPLARLAGRIAAKDIISSQALPNTPAASCHGIACPFGDLPGGAPVRAEGREYARCNTGRPIGAAYGAMLAIESVVPDERQRLKLSRQPAQQGEGVVPPGRRYRWEKSGVQALARAGEQLAPALSAP